MLAVVQLFKKISRVFDVNFLTVVAQKCIIATILAFVKVQTNRINLYSKAFESFPLYSKLQTKLFVLFFLVCKLSVK